MDTYLSSTRWDFIGLSTESKPTATSNKVVDGSTFYEADTSKLYIWTKDRWYEKTSNVLTNLEKQLKWQLNIIAGILSVYQQTLNQTAQILKSQTAQPITNQTLQNSQLKWTMNRKMYEIGAD